MGLDNIPHVYACQRAGTAIMTADDRIDCDKTIAAHQCPWQREAIGRGTPIVGMFGTPCWYRGKAATWMLEELTAAGYADMPGSVGGFYGTSPETTEGEPDLTPDHCRALARWMEDHAEAYAALHQGDADGGRVEIDEYRYAAWWLRFAADHCEGADAWW